MWHIWKAGKEHIEFWCAHFRQRVLLEDLGVEGRAIIKWIFNKWNEGRAWTGLVWLRLGTGGQLLLMW